MHQLFVTQIYHRPLKTDLKDLREEVALVRKADVKGKKWSKLNYPNGYTSYGSWDQLHLMSSTFEKLQKKIDTEVQMFAAKLDFDIKKNQLKMNTLWINVMPAGALHTSHLHPHSVISGTYYVDVPAAASAIKFEDPRLGLFMNTPAVKNKARKTNLRFFSLSPKAGDLVLFESWLKHEVPLNKSNKNRISVSFNYGWA